MITLSWQVPDQASDELDFKWIHESDAKHKKQDFKWYCNVGREFQFNVAKPKHIVAQPN